jgi:hypothetical protein
MSDDVIIKKSVEKITWIKNVFVCLMMSVERNADHK